LICDKPSKLFRLSLHDGTGRVLARNVAGPHCPRRAADLSDRRLDAALVPVLGTRALLPVRAWSVEMSSQPCRNAEGKLLGEIMVERHRLDDQRVLVMITLWPRRGYRKELGRAFAERTPAHLEHLAETSSALIDRLLPPEPGTAVDLPRLELHADDPLRPALGGLLSRYRALMELNEHGILADLDSEFLHDYRVALRRSRTLIQAFAAVAAPPPLQDGLAWLSAQTSLLRDLDVWLEDRHGTVASVGSELRTHVAARRQREQGRLGRLLRSARYRRVQADWQSWLATLALRGEDMALGPAANAAIWKRYCRLQRRIRRHGASPALAVLHDMRKDTKKLRYLIDAFATLYPRSVVDTIVHDLKRLQTAAGALCDHRARIELLANWRESCEREALRAALDDEIEHHRAEESRATEQCASAARLEQLASASFAHTVRRLCGKSNK
jgi:CHAD domain-containing protein